MSARSRGTVDDLNLSLTGSQISNVSTGRKAVPPRQLKRPSSVTDVRVKQGPAKPNTTGLEKNKRTGSHDNAASRGQTPDLPYSHRSGTSSVSSALKSNPNKGKAPSDDFLALFENSVQPKIKTPAKKKEIKKPTKNAVKVLWGDPPLKKFVPTSARSNSTVDTFVGSNGLLSRSAFEPECGSSSEEDLDLQIQDRLSHSYNRIQGLPTPPVGDSVRNMTHSQEEVLNSNRSAQFSSKQSHTVNSIANNMTLQAMSPKAKTSLSSMENSYQNIKHKTPVNQEKVGSSNQVSRNVAEDYVTLLNSSATKIQKWYRRHFTRGRASRAALQRLMSQKKQEKVEQLERESQSYLLGNDLEDKRSEDRRRVRDEKAKEARQHAIQELNRKREEKRQDIKKKAEEEISFLQASGKITKAPMKAGLGKKKVGSKPSGKRNIEPKVTHGSDSDPESKLTDRSQNRSVAEFFETGLTENGVATARSAQDRSVTDVSTLVEQSEAATKTTLDDLLQTLKKLEGEETLESARHVKKNSWFDDDMDKNKDGAAAGHEDYLTADKLRKLNPPKDGLTASGFLSDDKLKSILSFLDEVQVTDRVSTVEQDLAQSFHVELEKPPLLVPSVDELAEIEEAQAAANEVTSTVLTQRLELEEKKRTVQMLQKALNQQRELTVRHARETEKEMKHRLDVQKDEYEEAIKRHLSFIDQLIDDKKTLGEKCENLVKELKTVDKKYQDKIKLTEERNGIEIQKLRDMHEAAEKLRREKWIEDKTKKIKEMTVKGLEPEIQRLIAKHKSEFKKVKQIQEAELLEADERAAQRYVKMTEELRDQLAKEKEAACARERELAKQRYEKQLQQEEEAYQQQRRRMYSEIQEEKERIAEQASRQRTELDRLQRQLEDSHRQALTATKGEFEKAREEQERRHATEVRELHERLRLEKEAWEENYMKKHETWLMQKERELKENVRRDRDKEIELIIARLEEDASSAREECERTAENKIKRMRDKYEAEMKELERSERQALEKYNEMKGRLTEVQGENECLKVQLKQKDQEILDLKKLTDKMHEERGRVSDIIRQEFADRLVTTEEENKRIKTEMSEMKARHRLELDKGKEEIEEIKRLKDKEMDEVHQRVKQAILKKEEVVTQIRQQYQAALKRADHLEGLLQQQRKQLLGTK